MNRRIAGHLAALAGLWHAPSFAEAPPDPLTELARMSLEQLANVEVTSVSKSAQSLAAAPASIYVITREEILRSGAVSIPEALRLAPNLQVTQFSSTDYEIGARGFGGNRGAQNFSNKILILIDGRSVYNPLFSGVTYDALDVLMADVDRIEVISGPGATLWGVNAMNGVINIITRPASETQGGHVNARAGSEELGLGTRYGGHTGALDYRVYAKGFERGPSETGEGASAGDRWNRVQAGFRIDTPRDRRDAFTLQGDVQQASFAKRPFADVDLTQANLLGRWERGGERSSSRLQVFVDHTDRGAPPEGVAIRLSTYDVEFQQSWTPNDRHKVVWGVGRRYNDYEVDNSATLMFEPAARTLEQTNVFAQDSIALTGRLQLSAGLKLEENAYSGWSALPDVRLSYQPASHLLVWVAAARAVRSPTPFDVDVIESFGGPPLLFGAPDFRTEKVWAYEVGFRGQPHSRLSWSVSAFYDDYDDLRSVEGTPVTFFPLYWDNLIEGSTYGVEAWASVQVTDWWRLSPGFRALRKRLEFSEGAVPVIDIHQVGNDPRSQGSLKSSMDFGAFDFDATLRHVGELPSPAADDYTELSMRLSYRVSDKLELAVTGFNLLADSHLEYAPSAGNRIRRSVFAEVRLDF